MEAAPAAAVVVAAFVLTRIRAGGRVIRRMAERVRDLAGSENLTDVIFVGDLAAQRREDGDIEVEVKTTRPSDRRSEQVLRAKAEDNLRGRQ